MQTLANEFIFSFRFIFLLAQINHCKQNTNFLNKKMISKNAERMPVFRKKKSASFIKQKNGWFDEWKKASTTKVACIIIIVIVWLWNDQYCYITACATAAWRPRNSPLHTVFPIHNVRLNIRKNKYITSIL